jgi:hypothetical protein
LLFLQIKTDLIETIDRYFLYPGSNLTLLAFHTDPANADRPLDPHTNTSDTPAQVAAGSLMNYEEDFQYNKLGDWPRDTVTGITKKTKRWKVKDFRNQNFFIAMRCFYEMDLVYLYYEGYQVLPWSYSHIDGFSNDAPSFYLWFCIRTQIVLKSFQPPKDRELIYRITLRPWMTYLDQITNNMEQMEIKLDVYMRPQDIEIDPGADNEAEILEWLDDPQLALDYAIYCSDIEARRYTMWNEMLKYAIVYFLQQNEKTQQYSVYSKTVCNIHLDTCQTILLEYLIIDPNKLSIVTDVARDPPAVQWLWAQEQDPQEFEFALQEDGEPSMPRAIVQDDLEDVVKAFYGERDFCDEDGDGDYPYIQDTHMLIIPENPAPILGVTPMTPSGLPKLNKY